MEWVPNSSIHICICDRKFRRLPLHRTRADSRLQFLVFGLIVVVLKFINGAPWWGLVDLSQYGNVVQIFADLDEIGFRGAAEAEPPNSLWNLWGRI
jgi:hypothetical protein